MWAAWVWKAVQAFSFFWYSPLEGFPWWTWAHKQKTEAENTSSKWIIWSVFYPPIWKWRETASNLEVKDTEQRWTNISLEITFAGHFNYHLLPEDSFVQSRMKPALALTCNAKWWMSLKGELKGRPSPSGGTNHMSIGSRVPSALGLHLPDKALFSLQAQRDESNQLHFSLCLLDMMGASRG